MHLHDRRESPLCVAGRGSADRFLPHQCVASVGGNLLALAKGRKVAVVGELQARQYEAKDGTTRMSLDVSADEVEFLSPKGGEDGMGGGYSAPRPQAAAQDLSNGFTDINSDELPF